MFGLADPGDFGVSVDDRGDSGIVDVAVTGTDVFGDGDTYKSDDGYTGRREA